VTIAEFLNGQDRAALHWEGAHLVLVMSAGTFWIAMLSLPVLFGQKITRSPNVPLSSLMFFMLTSVTCVALELWVVIHTRQGLYFLQNAWEFICTKPMAVLAVLLSVVGRYDTFADIIFTIILFKDAEHNGPITWFSIKDHKFWLPMPLHMISFYAVLIGVFICQALPGMILLISKKYLPMAFKFNEFQLLLAMTELELDETNINQ